MMIRSAFFFFFSPKQQHKDLYWGLAEGEIIFFTAAPVMLCLYLYPKQHRYHTNALPTAGPCTAFIRFTDHLSDSQHKGFLSFSFCHCKGQAGGEQGFGRGHRWTADPKRDYTPCNTTTGNKTFSQ